MSLALARPTDAGLSNWEKAAEDGASCISANKTFIKGYFGEKGGFDYATLSAADREALLAHVSGIEELEIRRAFLELSFGWIEQVAALPDQVRLLCAHCKGWCEPKAAEEEEAEQEGQGPEQAT